MKQERKRKKWNEEEAITTIKKEWREKVINRKKKEEKKTIIEKRKENKKKYRKIRIGNWIKKNEHNFDIKQKPKEDQDWTVSEKKYLSKSGKINNNLQFLINQFSLFNISINLIQSINHQ